MLNRNVSLLVDVVAVYRLTKLINEDYITEDLRELVFKHFPPKKSKFGYLFTCPWCMSVWTAGAILTLRRISPETADYVSSILAASAVTGLAASKGL